MIAKFVISKLNDILKLLNNDENKNGKMKDAKEVKSKKLFSMINILLLDGHSKDLYCGVSK